MTARVPPFVPTVGETFDPLTELGVVQNGGATITNGNVNVKSIENARDSTVSAAFLPPQALDATNVQVLTINQGVNYTTVGSQDNSGTNLDGVGGLTVKNTTEFDTLFVTANPTLNQGGIYTLIGQTYYIGTDGTHALVESVIVVTGPLGGFLGHGGTLVVDAVLSNNPFITATSAAVAVNYTFDSQGAVLPCYLRGTMIGTPDGERSVEALSIGDLVTTASGAQRAVRWVGTRSYAGRFASSNRDIQPVVFKAHSIAENQPVRDLRVSPEHAMFVDGVLVPAIGLVNGVSIVRAEGMDDIEYFHVELDSHDVLIADGALSESFVDCDSLNMFHNAAEHRALYAENQTARWTFCAPRVEDGVRLEAIRSRLALRASGELSTVRTDAVVGFLDTVQHDMVSGWAYDPSGTQGSVVLEVLVDGGIVGRTVANRMRPDVKRAGVADGRVGFAFEFAAPLSSDDRHEVSVRIAGTDTVLANAPRTLAPAYTVSARTITGFRSAIESAVEHGHVEHSLAVLADATERLRAARDTRNMPGSRLAVSGLPLALVVGDSLAAIAGNAGDVASLVRLGYRVAVVSTDLADGTVDALDMPNVEIVGGSEFASVESVLAHFANEVSLAFVSGLRSLGQYGGLIRAHCGAARVVASVDAVSNGTAADWAHVVLARSAEAGTSLRGLASELDIRTVSADADIDAVLASVVGSAKAPRTARVAA